MRSALLLARPTLLLAPLLLPFAVPLAVLPPAVAYVVSEARWLVVLGAVCAETSLLLASAGWNMERVRLRVSRLIGAVAPRSFAILVWTLAFAGILLLIPGYCFRGDSFGGDEPKYLRLTESLYGDLDVDVTSNREAPLTPSRFAANLRALAASTRKAVAGLSRDEPVPASHVWNRGNWTLAGRAGGLDYLQSPGLPLVLLPSLAVQRLLVPEHGGPHFAMITLAALWATALLQTARLAAEVVGSREGRAPGVARDRHLCTAVRGRLRHLSRGRGGRGRALAAAPRVPGHAAPRPSARGLARPGSGCFGLAASQVPVAVDGAAGRSAGAAAAASPRHRCDPAPARPAALRPPRHRPAAPGRALPALQRGRLCGRRFRFSVAGHRPRPPQCAGFGAGRTADHRARHDRGRPRHPAPRARAAGGR